jgi:hypothetical protein
VKRILFRHFLVLTVFLLCALALSACDGFKTGQDTMPVVTIDFEGIPTKDTYVPCTISVVNEQGVLEIELAEAEIRLRGHSTLNFAKKPYRIKFETRTSPLNLGSGPARSWVLLAEYVDQSLLRNDTTYRLARRLLGTSFSTDATHVEVTVNGVFQGVYLLAEQTQIAKYRIDLAESGVDDPGYLLELESDQSRRDEEGTYLIDWFDIPGYTNNDVIYGWWNMHEYFLSYDAAYYVIKSDATSFEQIAFIQNDMKGLYDAVYQIQTEKAVTELIAIDSAVDMYILQLLTNDYDHNYSSNFLYKDKGKKIIFGPPWDYDLAYGNHVLNTETDTIHVHHLLYELSTQSWFQRLVKTRWNAINEEEIFIIVEEEIRTTYERYEDSFQKDYELWNSTRTGSDWHGIYRTFDSPEEAMEQMLEFIDRRLDFIEAYIKNWKVV